MPMRLDELLAQKNLAPNRSRAKQWIKKGLVFCDGKQITKPAALFDDDVSITVQTDDAYVGRGAYKMEAAVGAFHIDPTGLVVADVGASTGGFTDYLLRHGAIKSYAIDVGHDQLAEPLRNDERVINMEGVNIRDGVKLPEKVDLAVVDLSFISLKNCLKPIADLLKPHGQMVVLFKPQFEAGPGVVNKNGIIKNKTKRERVLKEFLNWCHQEGYRLQWSIESPEVGNDGNVEYLLHFVV